MDKEIARKWVEALRSGEYQQNRHGCLSDTESGLLPSYCCLGVLRKIQGGKPYDREATSLLSPEHSAGLSEAEMIMFADLNDGNGPHGYEERFYTFAEIADIIEQRYLTDEPAVTEAPL